MTVTVNEALTPAQELAAVGTRYLPRRACCQLGNPLVIQAARPSFHHDHPRRPCVVPTAPAALAAPRRALEDLDRAGVARTAQGNGNGNGNGW